MKPSTTADARIDSAPTPSGQEGIGTDFGHTLTPWLPGVAEALSDGQGAQVARSWMLRLQRLLDVLPGGVPFTVVHDWYMGSVAPLLAEAGDEEAAESQRAVVALHHRALAGEPVAQVEWLRALEPALRYIYKGAYPYAQTYETACSNAYAYAIDNGFEEERAVRYGETYAELSTSANSASYADAHARAKAEVLAAALASADAQAYANTYPAAEVHAWAHAFAATGDQTARDERLRKGYRLLAEGLSESLARVAV